MKNNGLLLALLAGGGALAAYYFSTRKSGPSRTGLLSPATINTGTGTRTTSRAPTFVGTNPNVPNLKQTGSGSVLQQLGTQAGVQGGQVGIELASDALKKAASGLKNYWNNLFRSKDAAYKQPSVPAGLSVPADAPVFSYDLPSEIADDPSGYFDFSSSNLPGNTDTFDDAAGWDSYWDSTYDSFDSGGGFDSDYFSGGDFAYA